MKIIIDRQRVYARHGVLPQEQCVGAYFEVSTEAETAEDIALQSDSLTDTVSYAQLAQIVEQEMHEPSRLLENVAWRIASRMLGDCPTLKSVTIRVMKQNPPMEVECQGAGVEITLCR